MYDPIEHDFNSWCCREEREDALECLSYQFEGVAEGLLLYGGWSSDDEGWSSDDEGFESDDEGFESKVHSIALELAEQEMEEAKREWKAAQKEIYDSRYDDYYN